eukprot:224343-Prorocentrum_lima.AAC.1
MKGLVVPSLKVVGSQMLGRDDVAAAMGFGDAGLVLDTCKARMTEWLGELQAAVEAGLDTQTACQLLGWVGSSLAVHTVRTSLQDQ